MTAPARTVREYPHAQFRAALELHKCSSCGGPDGFMFDYGEKLNSEVLCRRCTQNVALTETARTQLERLVIPVLRAWATHWGPLLASTEGYSDVADMLLGLGQDFEKVTEPALEGLIL